MTLRAIGYAGLKAHYSFFNLKSGDRGRMFATVTLQTMAAIITEISPCYYSMQLGLIFGGKIFALNNVNNEIHLQGSFDVRGVGLVCIVSHWAAVHDS